MSEPNSGEPDNRADAEVRQATNDAPESSGEVDLDLDEAKLEKWDEVKSDYQVDPDGKPMPNIWDAGEVEPEHEAGAEQREKVNNEDAPEVFVTDSDERAGDDDGTT
jgi:hypothetical protein